MRSTLLLFLAAVLSGPRADAQSGAGSPNLTFIPGSSVKLYQVNGDCDWSEWDATITTKLPICKPTSSQTATKADVLGDDVASSFEHNGELIMMFGDTIGADAYYPKWVSLQNTFQWHAHDPIARSSTQHAQDGLLLNFFTNGNHGLEVLPPPLPDGTAVDMTVDNIPEGGISLDGQIYIVAKTGSVDTGGNIDNSHAYSVLVKFDEGSQGFSSARTMSKLPGGHFVHLAMYEAPPGLLGNPPPVLPEPVVVMFGLGDYRASNVYLSVIAKSQFESGVDSSGQSGTRYFSGLIQGRPTWSQNESASVPVLTDLDPANPTIGNISAFYSQQVDLWLMTFDGGRGSDATAGVYFAYARQPWGPWSKPQLIFNDCRDKGLGNFIFYYYKTTAANNCPSAMPPAVTSAPNSAGPSGPTIGDQIKNDPTTTRGGSYAPLMVERFTTITGDTLEIFYTLSTWNPYAVVMMESDFTFSTGPVISLVANAEGESTTIAPNTWVEIKGSNLAPAGDSRIWQGSDFVGNTMPTQLDKVNVTVNGKNAYLYYISPTQANVLTPPDAMSGPVQVVLTNEGASASFTAQAQPTAPSFFVFNGGPYIAATHANGTLLGPVSLYPGSTTPARPGETVVLYANGFGQTSAPVVSGSIVQSGSLSPQPVIKIGGITATVQFAGLVSPGEFQFNVVVPGNTPNGDQPITATYNGSTTQGGTLIAIQP